MATASITNFELTILNDSVFAIINNLKKQQQRANLHKFYNELMRAIDFANT